MSADLALGSVLPDAVGAHVGAEFRSLDHPAWQGIETEFAQAAMRASRQLVFVDPATPDYRSILDGLIAPQADGRTVEVVLLDNARDGLKQISDALGVRSNLDAVHIISHGEPGELQLGGTKLGFDALLKNAGKVKGWAESLAPEAGIVLHGTEVGTTEQGQALVAALAKLTGADVSADGAPASDAVDASSYVVGTTQTADIAPTGATTASNEIVFDELVIVDPTTPDYQQIVDDILAQRADGRVIEVLVLDPTQDGVAQITAALAGRTGLDALHIVSHGDAGAIQLGGATLDFNALVKSAAEIKGWGGALSDDADILIYGCDVASTSEGRAFVDALARLTGADVAASDDLTGDSKRGGDWELEYVTGAIGAQIAVSAHEQGVWSHVLAEPAYVGNGVLASGIGAITPALPAGLQVGDVLLAVFESQGDQAVTINNPNGGTWNLLANPNINTGNNSTRLTAFWSVYNGTQGNPTTNDPGNHISGFIAAFVAGMTFTSSGGRRRTVR